VDKDWLSRAILNLKSIDLTDLTADPTLVEGLVWFRADTDQLRFSPDGVSAKTLYPAEAPSPPSSIIANYVGPYEDTNDDLVKVATLTLSDVDTTLWIPDYFTVELFGPSGYTIFARVRYVLADGTMLESSVSVVATTYTQVTSGDLHRVNDETIILGNGATIEVYIDGGYAGYARGLRNFNLYGYKGRLIA